ncbi:hypothetical protein [Neogemmobacter tilapiae]|uniref:D-galactarate dehydratase n=1 Tax=Neogemmobacter tilapiae TaxID=875041 RepID=A0A918WNM0_9RHOB|nr:hypothetical protein [Gemmobacter tilapiae]GHC59835.1 hypothetical protein GCM10007315_24550 [Gemmobacter tilapiae]
MMQKILPFVLILSLSACAAGEGPFAKRSKTPQDFDFELDAPPPPPPGATSAEALDTTTDAQKAEALAAAPTAGEASLGKMAVSLGKATEPGFWLRGAAVKAAGKGRVETADGQSVQVDLIPGEGAAQLSLGAFRALGLSLTALPEVTVFAE